MKWNNQNRETWDRKTNSFVLCPIKWGYEIQFNLPDGRHWIKGLSDIKYIVGVRIYLYYREVTLWKQ